VYTCDGAVIYKHARIAWYALRNKGSPEENVVQDGDRV
jgi:hypothetical protein